jgi:hypothetical protein
VAAASTILLAVSVLVLSLFTALRRVGARGRVSETA